MRDIRIYNTLSKKIEQFQPIHEKKIDLYVCGPTVYDFPHLGHAKTTTQFDFIVRYLRWKGYEVYYLQNITDIDDKIIARANERAMSWKQLAREYETIYLEDMISLHNTSVSKYVRATDEIDGIVHQIMALLDRGSAYRASDGIYFEIAQFQEYGKLSGRTDLQKEDAISRIDESAEKRGWNDFCLWKTSKTGEPFWETELGTGRPGWHIEDTAITEKYFGPQYDIHGGGIDLMFPHHEAEIAIMETISGKSPLANFWMHTGFMNIETWKMSKSLGNYKTIRDALASYSYRVLRFFFISSHYRTSIDYSAVSLEQAKNSLKRIDDFVFSIDPNFDDRENVEEINKLNDQLTSFLDNDFDTPKAFGAIYEFIRNQNIKGKAGRYVYDYFSEINKFLDFLQFSDENDMEKEIAVLVEEREKFRKNKQYDKADEIRDSLAKKGVEVYDTREGVRWRKIT